MPYAGASTNKSIMGLGADVVLSLLEVVKNPTHHRVFFDNFFSSFKLLKTLAEKKIAATGTVRSNRTSDCPFKPEKELKKEERGAYDARCDPNTKILVASWNDNSVVNVISNCLSVEPMHTVKRYDRKQRKEVNVKQPALIYEYNQNIRGVDLHDNGIANYRIKIHGKKWWWPLFINTLDSAIVNAWKIHNIVSPPLNQLDFRRYLVQSFLKGDIFEDTIRTMQEDPDDLRQFKMRRGRPSEIELPDEVRRDNVGHIILRDPEDRRRRCRHCKSQTIYLCAKCDVGLHPDCFLNFHI